jgi:hypothetical protein
MKKLAGTIGIVMLFAVPTEATWRAIGIYALWLIAAVLLLAYAGAFKRKLSTSKTSKI